MTILIALLACATDTPEEAAKRREAYYKQEYEDKTHVFSPREGVECYLIEGVGTTRTRVFSCVALPVPQECPQ